ncbi:MAG: hypothetical protein ACO1RX_03495 [Candidatus Sericytochromatia bacterium]
MNADSEYIQELTRLAKMHTRTDFAFPKVDENYPPYSHLIIQAMSSLKDVPDIRRYKDVFVLSDYGGEHAEALFNTYTCVVCASDPLKPYLDQVRDLRLRHSMHDPYREYAYKRLGDGPMARSVEEFLEISNTFVPGLVVNLAIEKSINTIFGKPSLDKTIKYFSESGHGEWKKKEAEKLLRIAHLISIVLATITVDGQKFLWLSDNDSINEDGNKRNFQNTIDIFLKILGMYTKNYFELLGFARPFKASEDTLNEPVFQKMNNLLSLSDLAAGAFQDILKEKYSGTKLNLKPGKEAVIKWMGRDGVSLRKINMVFTKNNDGCDVSVVDIAQKDLSNAVEIQI